MPSPNSALIRSCHDADPPLPPRQCPQLRRSSYLLPSVFCLHKASGQDLPALQAKHNLLVSYLFHYERPAILASMLNTLHLKGSATGNSGLAKRCQVDTQALRPHCRYPYQREIFYQTVDGFRTGIGVRLCGFALRAGEEEPKLARQKYSMFLITSTLPGSYPLPITLGPSSTNKGIDPCIAGGSPAINHLPCLAGQGPIQMIWP